MRVIGITGGIGAGKSKVLQLLEQEFDAEVIEADKIAHELQAPGSKCYEEIVRTFGEDILEDKGRIDRAKLGSLVFSDQHKLEVLNSIVHPHVKKEITVRILKSQKKLVAIEAALLIEAKYNDILDELWYIYADEETRISRLSVQRNYTREKSLSIIKNQLKEEAYREAADVIIDNSRDFETTREQILRLIEKS